MHNFTESLEFSHKASDLPIWEEIYSQAFPGFVSMIDHRQDGEHQRAGIDRSIIMPTSKQILIDEKVRGRNKKTGKVYTDILLEYLSDEERNKPGWVCKPLRADYIAYAIAPLGIGYLLPVPQLQKAWVWNREEWIKDYTPPIKAYNQEGSYKWTTISVGVPVKVLFQEIGKCLRVNFEPLEMELV